MGAMKERAIGTGVHYPVIHLFKLYRALGFTDGMFPHAERIGRAIVTLPLFPAMIETDVERVCEAVTESVDAARGAA
jgi:dTDP-4-amino-4,6-dideoxygalactose transaminase